MMLEHNKPPVADWQFVTSNYGVRTTPRREWDLVSGSASTKTELSREDVEGGRRIPDIGNLQEMNLARMADLRKEEIIAVVLYTGPMVSLFKRNMDC